MILRSPAPTGILQRQGSKDGEQLNTACTLQSCPAAHRNHAPVRHNSLKNFGHGVIATITGLF